MSTMPRDLIIHLPNQHLRDRSKKVGLVSKETLKIIEDMKAATLDWENVREHELGVALAAVQIDCLLRIVIIREDFEDKKNKDFRVLINPEIVKKEGDKIEDFEGCLSIKDIYGKVPRYSKVKVKALDLQGREFRITAEGFLARVLQHEVDHTNGIVFIDHIKEVPDAYFKLDEKGHLVALDYEKDIKNSDILW